MIPVKQEDNLGCAVACVAFVLKIKYSDSLDLFIDGKKRVEKTANFYCPEIAKILNKNGLNYAWTKLSDKNQKLLLANNSIVFIKKSDKYPYGHFLTKHKGKWMDPWINLPEQNILAGFRDKLPNEPTYIIYKI